VTIYKRYFYDINIYQFNFILWFFWAFNTALTFLFFKNNPEIGTFFKIFFSILMLEITLIFIFSKSLKIKDKTIPAVIYVVIFYILWSGLSLFWTTAPFFKAFLFWFHFVSQIVTVTILVKIGNKDKIVTSSFKGYIIGTALVSVVLLFSGEYLDGRIGSEFLHPNVVGNQISTCVLLSLYLMFANEKVSLNPNFWFFINLGFILSLLIIISKTSIISLSLALLISLFFSKISAVKKILTLALIIIIVFLNLDNVYKYWDYYTSIGNGKLLTTLTGRTLIWNETIALIKTNYIFGFGFFSFRYSGPQLFSVRTETAHNEILQIMFTLGIIGLILVFLIYVLFLFQICKSLKNKSHFNRMKVTTCIGLLVYFSIRGLVEADSYSLVFFLPLLIILYFWLREGNYSATS